MFFAILFVVQMIKKKIPKALREQVWLKNVGKMYQAKCTIRWCQNIMTVFDFESGHNIPESKGGATTLHNLFPICSRCNRSMSDKYTIDEWNRFNDQTSNKTTTNNDCCTIV